MLNGLERQGEVRMRLQGSWAGVAVGACTRKAAERGREDKFGEMWVTESKAAADGLAVEKDPKAPSAISSVPGRPPCFHNSSTCAVLLDPQNHLIR